MASSSTSSIHKSFTYDVFLSFRGEDTRNTFVGHLYNALQQNGIETYKDDEIIKKGETIDTQLINSIKDSRFFIIVFSKNYASSSWCLDELVKIMECQKTTEQTAYPIFYDVKPTEVRKQSGAVEEAFKEHINKKTAGKWREALKEAADLAGWELKKTANGDESKLIQIVVTNIFKNISSLHSSVDGNLVGMEMRINEVLSSLEMGTKDVRMIGIKGMGGGGKTTLATALFNQISNQFEGRSFVENVREVSKTSLSGLKQLQKQILKDVFSDQDITVSSVSGGINMMVQMMRRKKVLVILDDVSDTKQLEALAGASNWFKPGSRIIITTRDEQVLLAHRLNFNHNFIHEVNLLSATESICLFSRHAFGREIPDEGYEHLSIKVVQYAAGLPLTIKVLGSFLCFQEKSEWNDALERLKTIPLNETMMILELSYNSLEDDYKDIFLDVACLLKGWYKKDAIIALESCGFRAINGLRVLEQRSLINISEYEELAMHDHIEEMGKNIVRRLNLDQPKRHSRLWIKEEIVDILANNKGTQATKCITMNASGLDFKFLMNGFTNMKELRFLHVDSIYVSKDKVIGTQNLDEVSLHLPNALRFLRWNGYPFSSLPKTIQAKNLVGLEMDESNIDQLWKDGEEKACLKLRFLKFRFSKLRTLDLSVAPNLEILILEHCDDLVEVRFQVTPNLKELLISGCSRLGKLHMPAVSPKLRSLDLSDSKLRNLHLGMTPNLETLRVKQCTDIVELHMPAECPKLINLDLSFLKWRTPHLTITPNLESLILYKCTDIVKLHMPTECPKLVNLDLRKLKLRTLQLGITPNLETLSLYKCTDMVELSMPADCPKLVNLDLSNLKLTTLHLGITPNLETLRVLKCTDMVELHMPADCPKLETLHLTDNAKLRILDIGLTPNLESLNLKNCYDLEEINAPAECLKKLLSLDISYCGRFKRFKFDKEPDPPKIVSLSELYLFAEDTGICHPGNTWPEFQFSCFYEEDPASSFGNLERLISLGFGAHINVDSFSDIICGLQCLRELTLEGGIPEAPKYLDRLNCLEELSLWDTDITHLPDGICTLKNLTSLEIIACNLLEKLPEDIRRLQCLEKLIVKDCIFLRDIPNSICEMHRLYYLDLTDCIRIEELPEEIGRLECLKELDITGTGINRLPQSIFQLKGLNIRGSTQILEYVMCHNTQIQNNIEDSDGDDDFKDVDEDFDENVDVDGDGDDDKCDYEHARISIMTMLSSRT